MPEYVYPPSARPVAAYCEIYEQTEARVATGQHELTLTITDMGEYRYTPEGVYTCLSLTLEGAREMAAMLVKMADAQEARQS